jgi:hypothetical protein
MYAQKMSEPIPWFKVP